MDIDPASLAPADRYKLLIGGVVPRPIAWVSTISPDGRLNLAPFSFFNAVSASPPVLMFAPANKPDGSEKDTLRNAKPAGEGGTGEFVVNIVPFGVARQMAACAEELAYGESEFELAGLMSVPSMVVRPPRVAESPLSFECRTLRVIRFGENRPGAGNMVLGEVVRVHAAPGVVNERWHVDPDALDAIARMGGTGYCRTTERFEMPMGRRALEGGAG
ncbi:MAG: flavin reductase family protein [Phycisphaerales bacterium]